MENTSEYKVQSFRQKWYRFFIFYGLISIVFFIGDNIAISRILSNFALFYPKDFSFDGANFAVVIWLASTPLFIVYVLITASTVIGLEFAASFIFKSAYMKTTVQCDDVKRLNKSIGICVACFAFASLAGVVFWFNIWRVVLFIILYFPLPLIALISYIKKREPES